MPGLLSLTCCERIGSRSEKCKATCNLVGGGNKQQFYIMWYSYRLSDLNLISVRNDHQSHWFGWVITCRMLLYPRGVQPCRTISVNKNAGFWPISTVWNSISWKMFMMIMLSLNVSTSHGKSRWWWTYSRMSATLYSVIEVVAVMELYRFRYLHVLLNLQRYRIHDFHGYQDLNYIWRPISTRLPSICLVGVLLEF